MMPAAPLMLVSAQPALGVVLSVACGCVHRVKLSVPYQLLVSCLLMLVFFGPETLPQRASRILCYVLAAVHALIGMFRQGRVLCLQAYFSAASCDTSVSKDSTDMDGVSLLMRSFA
ncbi:hypothetical protein COO60DRAFT_508494 [Scenedesmus sp. NREL 46B-D3]|nr:hypothetical protein COO60DRAFT_508494 [Scenedesmus sp. NREL 46B-D3]